MSSNGRTALVTGGASGIGRAIALRLARDGADVAILDLDLARAEDVAGEVRALGRRSVAVRADVASWESAEAAVGEARRALGRISILVNDAGIGEVVPVLHMTPAQWHRMIAVHLDGTFFCTRLAAPDMVEAGWGRIVNISSVAALGGSAALSHYAAAKAGVIGFTKSLAQELGSAGVTVNALAPGLIDTPILDKAGVSQEMRRGTVRRSPIPRIGVPDDIAAACAYVVSEEAGFLTGQVISPNGGIRV